MTEGYICFGLAAIFIIALLFLVLAGASGADANGQQ
jgi:hypothetical protein